MHCPDEVKTKLSETYSEDFFKEHHKNLQCYEKIAEYLKKKVTSITDFGCGHGYLIECLIKQGINAFGVEGSESAKNIWPKDSLSYSIVDFTKEFSLNDLPKTEYIISTEVAEHLPSEFAEKFIQILLYNNPKKIFFSAATVYQDCGNNPSHVNEKPLTYWVKLFNDKGYDIDIDESFQIKQFFNNNFNLFKTCWWYPKNLIVFTKNELIDKSNLPNLDYFNFIPKYNCDNNILDIIFQRDYYEYSNLILIKYLEYTQNKKLCY